jgi:hypothetical protein
MTKAKARKRRSLKLLTNESVWLQKALFAFQKAEIAWEKRMETEGNEDADYVIEKDGETFPVEEFVEAIEDRVAGILAEVKERRRIVR